ncbi:DUF1826 domain-containing protein [Vibrio maerlii]|uniref:DUF1826 domain-containing protein n=1 Tax=Vibrio maerlii TaxID=2231648 RepID=UPI000E3BFEF8|nr:DUF1826 domain-containing protein [Vibrio maerlii]
MELAIAEKVTSNEEAPPSEHQSVAHGKSPTVFTDIYRDEVKIAIWNRAFSAVLQKEIAEFITHNPNFEKSLTIKPQDAHASLYKAIGDIAPSSLVDNIAELVDMFGCLFDLEHVGVRLATLNKAMCPKFHVDRVPCRLVTTYQGIATQWLHGQDVDRSKLGSGSNGLPDSDSGLYRKESNIQHLIAGDVALLKGESWIGNENQGLVHRSPMIEHGESRLLLTLDFR